MFEDLQQAMAGAKLLGVLSTWDLHTTGNLLTRRALSDAAEKHNVELEISEPHPEGIFRKIISSVRTIRKPLISRLIKEDDGILVWALVDTSLEGTEKVGDEVGKMVNRVAYRRINVDGQSRFLFEVDDEVGKTVADRFDFQMNYLSNDDVRTALGNTLRAWGAIRIHARMYFLGRSHVEHTQRLQAVLQEVGTRFWLIPIPDLLDSTQSINYYAHERYEQELRGLRTEVDRWTSGERAPRRETLQNRIATYEQLGGEIRGMVTEMKFEADDLLDELAGLTRGVQKLLEPEPEPEENGTKEASDQNDCAAEKKPPKPPSRPGSPADQTLDQLSVQELRVKARDLGVKPLPSTKQKLIAAIREATA